MITGIDERRRERSFVKNAGDLWRMGVMAHPSVIGVVRDIHGGTVRVVFKDRNRQTAVITDVVYDIEWLPDPLTQTKVEALL